MMKPREGSMKIWIYCLSVFASLWNINAEDIFACEKQTMKISCTPGTLIDITTAQYGRSDPTTCDGGPSACGSPNNALEKMKAVCKSKQKCDVIVTNEAFFEPCVGIAKYLKVSYECVGKYKAKLSAHTSSTPIPQNQQDTAGSKSTRSKTKGGNGRGSEIIANGFFYKSLAIIVTALIML